MTWEKKEIEDYENLTLEAKLVLVMIKRGLVKMLTFDMDGTLIHSMEWYWFVWDRTIRNKGIKQPLDKVFENRLNVRRDLVLVTTWLWRCFLTRCSPTTVS